MKQKYGFGSVLEDEYTGFKGKAISYSVHKNGCNAYFIQPPVDKDGKLQEGAWVKEIRCKLVAEGKPVEDPGEQIFKFDDVVKCSVTGYQGKVTAFAYSVEGMNRYTIQPPVDKDGKYRDGFWFDEDQIELVEAAIKPKKEVKPDAPVKKTGGFPSRLR